MAYFDNIPIATEAPADTRPKLVQNFTAIKALLGIDHKNFGDAQEGKHDKVTLPVRGTVPAPAGTDLVLYNKLVSGKAHVFAKNLTDDIDLTTASITSTSGTLVFPALKLVWGQVSDGTRPTTAGLTFNYHSAFASTVYAVYITPIAGDAFAHFSVTSATKTTCTYAIRALAGASVPCKFYYLAIGA